MKKTNFPERGRNTEHAARSWPARLSRAVASEASVTWHRPEHRSDYVDPGESLRNSYMDGVKAGGDQ